MKDLQEILGAVVDKVLAYKPKWKAVQAKRYKKKQKRKKKKIG